MCSALVCWKVSTDTILSDGLSLPTRAVVTPAALPISSHEPPSTGKWRTRCSISFGAIHDSPSSPGYAVGNSV
jgi:hypothetical protein